MTARRNPGARDRLIYDPIAHVRIEPGSPLESRLRNGGPRSEVEVTVEGGASPGQAAAEVRMAATTMAATHLMVLATLPLDITGSNRGSGYAFGTQTAKRTIDVVLVEALDIAGPRSQDEIYIHSAGRRKRSAPHRMHGT